MAKTMWTAAVVSLLAAALFAALANAEGVFVSLAITCGTVAYHLWMRLAVGGVFTLLMRNRADPNARWFRPRPWEAGFYRRLGVRQWKNRVPTYRPELFDPRKRSWDEIAQAMCQAELVHETIALLSFLPIAASRRFGALPVFLATSLLSAAADLAFAAVQRCNRPVVVRLAERMRRRGKASAEQSA